MNIKIEDVKIEDDLFAEKIEVTIDTQLLALAAKFVVTGDVDSEDEAIKRLLRLTRAEMRILRRSIYWLLPNSEKCRNLNKRRPGIIEHRIENRRHCREYRHFFWKDIIISTLV